MDDKFLDNLPLKLYQNYWYQLDGAPRHYTSEVSRELTNMFEFRWILRLGPWIWPLRSPDLISLVFYLWGEMKEKLYRTSVITKQELENRYGRLDTRWNKSKLYVYYNCEIILCSSKFHLNHSLISCS